MNPAEIFGFLLILYMIINGFFFLVFWVERPEFRKSMKKQIHQMNWLVAILAISGNAVLVTLPALIIVSMKNHVSETELEEEEEV